MYFTYISMLLLTFTEAKRDEGIVRRNKRHLVYTQGGGYKLVIGIAIPYKVGPKQSLICGLNFQYQYAEPTNITQLEKPYPPIIAKSRERRDSSIDTGRTLFYLGVESGLNRYGVNGRACLLRAICDNAMSPINHHANGLYGELLHLVLTPVRRGKSPRLDAIYADAQKAGEFGVDCASLYPECPGGFSIMDIVTVTDN